MFDLSRRELLASGVVAGAVTAATPTKVLAQAAEGASAIAAWDLRDLFPTDAAWEAERLAILKDVPALKAYQGKLGSSAATLKAALQAQSDINRRTSRLYTYASLKADEDRRVAANQERKQKAQDVFTALGEATSWSGHRRALTNLLVVRQVAARTASPRGHDGSSDRRCDCPCRGGAASRQDD